MKRLFMVLGTDKTDVAELRQEIRPSHRAYLRVETALARVVLAGPTFDSSSEKMNGTLLVVEAACAEDVRKFINDDPYIKADIFKDVQIRPWIAGIVKEF